MKNDVTMAGRVLGALDSIPIRLVENVHQP